MKNQNLQNLKGFRDFLPKEKSARDQVQASITQTFTRFGFAPVETPTLEYADLLLGKYGDEADKLVYQFTDRGDRQVALRYDQTVPTARLLAQYQNDIPKYWRRYQIQNVFRADKPQRARYREFTQCDCDIFGSTDTLADAEILAVFASVYQSLGFKKIIIAVNDRESLISALQPSATDQVGVFSIIQSIDKLDKMSQSEVKDELMNKGLSELATADIFEALDQLNPSEKLDKIMSQAIALGVNPDWLEYRPTLARGLDYYTGLIFEGLIPDFDGGSIGGGGRYDNLLRDLAGVDMPAVGFGIGFDRTVEAAQALGLIEPRESSAEVLVTIFSEQTIEASLQLANQLRYQKFSVEVFPSLDPLPKQLKLANQKNIPIVVIIGEQELTNNQAVVKDMSSGSQETLNTSEVSVAIRKLLK